MTPNSEDIIPCSFSSATGSFDSYASAADSLIPGQLSKIRTLCYATAEPAQQQFNDIPASQAACDDWSPANPESEQQAALHELKRLASQLQISADAHGLQATNHQAGKQAK